MTPVVAYADQGTANRELESYILGGRYGRLSVPGSLDPVHVDQFLRRRLSRARPVSAFSRARRVVDYYELRSVLEHYERMLRMDEGDNTQFDQSVYSIMTLAEAGDENHDRRANHYFDHLVRHPLAPESYELLVEAVEALGPAANARLLADRMAGSLHALEPRAASDRGAGDELERIKQCLYDGLPRVMAARQLRGQVLSVSDPAARIDRLCRIYLGWAEDDSIELNWWSARWIRRAARAGHTELAVDAFRRIMREVDASDFDKQDKRAYRTLALRAVRFLGGALDDAERRVLERAGGAPMGALDSEL